MTANKLPTLYVLGAAKAGTSALYLMLNQHPEICMAAGKETGFFSSLSNYERGIDWYLETYFSHRAEGQVLGEITPSYLYFDRAAERIASHVAPGEATFVVILRNPIDRAYSWYWHMVRFQQEPMTFVEAFRTEAERLDQQGEVDKLGRNYVRSGLYASQLERWFRHMPREDFLILLQDDYRAKQSEVFRNLFQRLGVSDQVDIEPVIANRSGALKSETLQSALNGVLRAAGRVRPYLSQNAYDMALAVQKRVVTPLMVGNRVDFHYPEMPVEVRAELVELFRDDVMRLETMLDRDLSPWLSVEEPGL